VADRGLTWPVGGSGMASRRAGPPDRTTPGWGRWSALLDVRPSPPGRGLVACGARRVVTWCRLPGVARVQGG